MSDLIDRQAAIDAMFANMPGLMFNDVLRILRTLPSAQSERKTGRWEYVDYGGFGNWHCTACREICICNGDYDFCPNCGADMRGDVDEGERFAKRKGVLALREKNGA